MSNPRKHETCGHPERGGQPHHQETQVSNRRTTLLAVGCGSQILCQPRPASLPSQCVCSTEQHDDDFLAFTESPP